MPDRRPPSQALRHLAIERAFWSRGLRYVAGLDEAGRGCLAGPVVAAAVVFPPDVALPGIADSKTLSPAVREELAGRIRAVAVSVGIGQCTPAEIDRMNILWASMEAMRRAAATLQPPPDLLLIDGTTCFPDSPWPYETLVKGDGRCHAVAAASILAKTTRDRLMRALHEELPRYGWDTNVGYPTRAHYDALARHGPTPHHRRTFRLSSSR